MSVGYRMPSRVPERLPRRAQAPEVSGREFGLRATSARGRFSGLFAFRAPPPGLAADSATSGSARRSAPAKPTLVPIGYLKQEVNELIPLSRLNVKPEDLGIAGAEIALKDNNTTGKFTNQRFTLDVERVPVGGDAVAALQKLVDSGHHFVLVDAPADVCLRLSDSVKGKDVLLFNVSAPDERLRQEECRANVLHTAPDLDMLADALAPISRLEEMAALARGQRRLPRGSSLSRCGPPRGETLRRHHRRGARIRRKSRARAAPIRASS